MEIIQTNINDVIIIEPKVFSDQRGFFLETYQAERYRQAGIYCSFIQDNHSGSKKGTLRGLHYQIMHPQGKLVQVIRGKVFDVAVDIRKSSPSFGKYVGVVLSEENKRQLWIPPGFAHGFYVMSDWAEFTYKVSDIYSPESERTILWNDPDIKIDWPFDNKVDLLISEKDARGKFLREAEIFD